VSACIHTSIIIIVLTIKQGAVTLVMQLLRAWSITCNFIKCFSNQLYGYLAFVESFSAVMMHAFVCRTPLE